MILTVQAMARDARTSNRFCRKQTAELSGEKDTALLRMFQFDPICFFWMNLLSPGRVKIEEDGRTFERLAKQVSDEPGSGCP